MSRTNPRCASDDGNRCHILRMRNSERSDRKPSLKGGHTFLTHDSRHLPRSTWLPSRVCTRVDMNYLEQSERAVAALPSIALTISLALVLVFATYELKSIVIVTCGRPNATKYAAAGSSGAAR